MVPWAFLGQIFLILGVLEGCCFLMRFLIAKKSAQNRKNLQSWRPMANRTGFLERPGGMSGGAGEGL